MNKSLRILYVDDSPVILEMLEVALFNLGYANIESAEDGMEALEKIQEDDFDLIITDINMPNMDGFELISNLRAKLDYISVPILVLTTERSQAMKRKGLEVGATAWMVKPFTEEILGEVLEKMLERDMD
jgi:two-component system chemotaxis response regulator CheY